MNTISKIFFRKYSLKQGILYTYYQKESSVAKHGFIIIREAQTVKVIPEFYEKSGGVFW